MKEKVKDLDPVLIKMILKAYRGSIGVIGNEPAEDYLKTIDWKTKSNEERLKYAEWMYLDGVIFKAINSDKNVLCSGRLRLNGPDIIDLGSNWCVYYSGKWAEIISRPDEEPFKIDFSDNCTPEQRAEIERMFKEYYNKTSTAGSILMNGEPEFQPGEMVQYCFDEPNGWGSGEFIGKRDKYYVVFTGLKYLQSTIIRKIQPDPEKEIMTKVAQLKSKYVKGTACSGKGGTNSPYKIYDYMFEENGLDEMLIEALKTEVK